MANGERGQWPTGLPEWKQAETMHRTRENASRRMAGAIAGMQEPFVASEGHEQVLYRGVEKITRIPLDPNRDPSWVPQDVYQTALALKNVARVVAADRSFEELRAEVDKINGPVDASVLRANTEKQGEYETKLSNVMEEALRGVLEKQDTYPNPRVREAIQGVLEARDISRANGLL